MTPFKRTAQPVDRLMFVPGSVTWHQGPTLNKLPLAKPPRQSLSDANVASLHIRESVVMEGVGSSQLDRGKLPETATRDTHG